MVPNPEGLRALESGCDLVLCDIWGVLHNGVDVFIAAGDALRRFRETGGSVLLVSNAPRPAASVQRQLDGLGVAADTFDGIVTSGDVTRDEIAKLSNRRLHHVGPERDLAIFAGLDVSLVDLAEPDWVVCSGLVHDERETLDDYRERLHVMRQRGLGMICANPDIIVHRGARRVYCAGALAECFEAISGQVIHMGQPHRAIYQRALAQAAEMRGGAVGADRVLAIGDTMRTDIGGAMAMGLSAVFIAGGIHAPEYTGVDGEIADDLLSSWLAGQPLRPAAMLTHLRW